MSPRNSTCAKSQPPVYIAYLHTKREGSAFPIEEEIHLRPYFDRTGKLATFREFERIDEWHRDVLVQAQLEKAYERAAHSFAGRDPTPADADANGKCRLVTMTWKEETRNRLNQRETCTRTITIEASF